MLKHIYRVIVLVAVFAASIFFMANNINEQVVDTNTTVKMRETTFPILYLQIGNQTINLLHGYSGNMNIHMMRDSLTPIQKEQDFYVEIQENESVVKKLQYEIIDLNSDEVIDSGSVSALERTKENKRAKLRIKAELKDGVEYLAKFSVVTNTSKKIHYYTRLKQITSPHLDEKLEFVMNFHNSILDKDKANDIASFLETDHSITQTSLSRVTIHSPLDAVSFGELNLSVVTPVIPTIKEIKDETASIELSYVATNNSKKNPEFYQVKEFYRVRWTAGRMYLLYYERSMESLFDIRNADVKDNQFKIGITSNEDMEIFIDNNNSKACFVQNGSLWYYNILENDMVRVFSFLQKNTDYIRDMYDQHGISVISMSDEGNIDFIVYGYMNRGDYEGKTGIVLYKYYAGENRIEEKVYIPMDVPYEVMKEQLNPFCYVSNSDVFYFMLQGTIYSYNIATKQNTIIAEGIRNDQMVISTKDKYIAWQDNPDTAKSKQIIILDLETGNRKVVEAGAKENIRIFGSIDENFVYGYIRTKDIVKTKEGAMIYPAYRIVIANSTGEIRKVYEKPKSYVQDITVNDNIVELFMVKKSKEGSSLSYVPDDSDFILNQMVETENPITFTSKTTEKALKEWYLTLPSSVKLEKKPDIIDTLNTIITESTTLHLNGNTNSDKYYVYAIGSITGSYDEPSEAISKANEQMGVVLNRDFNIVWERGGKATRSSIYGISPINMASNISTTDACVSMLLSNERVSVNPTEVSSKGSSVIDQLAFYMPDAIPLNLTGCTLDEVLYFVSNKYPVIAFKDKTHAVLITAYDEFNVTVMDPTTGRTDKFGLSSADAMFEDAGYRFISYTK